MDTHAILVTMLERHQLQCIQAFGPLGVWEPSLNFRRSLLLELGEVVAELQPNNVRLWNQPVIDDALARARIEVVDCFYVMLSTSLKWAGRRAKAGTTNVIASLAHDWAYNLEDALRYEQALTTRSDLLGALDEFRANVLGTCVDPTEVSKCEDDLVSICNLLVHFGLSLDQVYQTYMGKSVLNEFRTNGGYWEGTYDKQWPTANGFESDSAVLRELLPSVNFNDCGARETLLHLLTQRRAEHENK